MSDIVDLGMHRMYALVTLDMLGTANMPELLKHLREQGIGPDNQGRYLIARGSLGAEIERLRKVVDAVRGARNATDNEQFRRAMDVVAERMRELEDS